ncbi:MAG: hypothetical protein KatS3mg131_3002 [Candidatus Tectimicrobiota bacterium]|nr:MAG: hypothetical protein KatS3mg131_3002 [Candidatus Tectomicrobia bacterium]
MAPSTGPRPGSSRWTRRPSRYLRVHGPEPRAGGAGGAVRQGAGALPHRRRPEPRYSEVVELDLATVEPGVGGPQAAAGPRPPGDGQAAFYEALRTTSAQGADSRAGRRRADSRWLEGGRGQPGGAVAVGRDSRGQRVRSATWTACEAELTHGSVVIAAITSCTNTSNPSSCWRPGCVAKKAVETRARCGPGSRRAWPRAPRW